MIKRQLIFDHRGQIQRLLSGLQQLFLYCLFLYSKWHKIFLHQSRVSILFADFAIVCNSDRIFSASINLNGLSVIKQMKSNHDRLNMKFYYCTEPVFTEKFAGFFKFLLFNKHSAAFMGHINSHCTRSYFILSYDFFNFIDQFLKYRIISPTG